MTATRTTRPASSAAAPYFLGRSAETWRRALRRSPRAAKRRAAE